MNNNNCYQLGHFDDTELTYAYFFEIYNALTNRILNVVCLMCLNFEAFSIRCICE